MSLEIHALDVHDEATFAAWHDVYLRAERHDLGVAATPWQREEVRAMMHDTASHATHLGWVGRDGGEVAAAGWARLPLLDNRELAEVQVHVAPEHRRRGHGTALLRAVEADLLARGRRIVTVLAGWPHDLGPTGEGAPGPSFARARGYDLALGEVQRELRLPVADEVLDRLAAEAASAHAAYTLRSWAGPVPDDLVEGWARLTATLVTEAPMGELELEQESASVEAVREREAVLVRQGRTKLNTVALDVSGEVVAYTDLATTVHEPDRAYQWGTLVHPGHRGHRLGVAVKVANLRLLQRERPDVVRMTTYNAEVNAHMIAVNEALGFRPVARLGDFQKRLDR
ncbi:GNAT family N-acetyltransferase [Nocardioides zeicaulis]|uniref:GNAT family N-acetyltransferase n=1 Tax=Nocardioides zeicaulis TaxID=1776857 RepID=A0ABV6E3V6_9ACTN